MRAGVKKRAVALAWARKQRTRQPAEAAGHRTHPSQSFSSLSLSLPLTYTPVRTHARTHIYTHRNPGRRRIAGGPLLDGRRKQVVLVLGPGALRDGRVVHLGPASAALVARLPNPRGLPHELSHAVGRQVGYKKETGEEGRSIIPDSRFDWLADLPWHEKQTNTKPRVLVSLWSGKKEEIHAPAPQSPPSLADAASTHPVPTPAATSQPEHRTAYLSKM